MKIPTVALLAIVALLPARAAPAGSDLVAVINGIRAEGCAGRPDVPSALRADPLLDRVAQALATGTGVREALRGSGYRAAQTATFEVSASEAQAVSHRVLELANEARARPRRCSEPRSRTRAASPRQSFAHA